MSNIYELTDETKDHEGTKVYRLRDKRTRVLGGWVERLSNVRDNARVLHEAVVMGNAIVAGNAVVRDYAVVKGNAIVAGNAWVHDNAVVKGNAIVAGNAWVHDEAIVRGNAHVIGTSRVSGDAILAGTARVDGRMHVGAGARLTETSHVLLVGPLGSENRFATLYRTETGHRLTIGCWSGTLDTLMGEVTRRRNEVWADIEAPEDIMDRWATQYEALVSFGKVVAEGW